MDTAILLQILDEGDHISQSVKVLGKGKYSTLLSVDISDWHYRLGSLNLYWQPVNEKYNSAFKPV